jgi:hypothetical protein
VELLFAAATTRNCQISFSLFSQRRSQKSDMAALVDEDLRWRSRSLRAGGRGHCVQHLGRRHRPGMCSPGTRPSPRNALLERGRQRVEPCRALGEFVPM